MPTTPKPCSERFGDRDVGRTHHGEHAVRIAAVQARGDRRLVQRFDRPPRLAHPLALGEVEELRQAGVFIAAKRSVDDVIGDDARLLRVEAEPAERGLRKRTRFVDAERNAVLRGVGRREDRHRAKPSSGFRRAALIR